jgi:hypothetical protein
MDALSDTNDMAEVVHALTNPQRVCSRSEVRASLVQC